MLYTLEEAIVVACLSRKDCEDVIKELFAYNEKLQLNLAEYKEAVEMHRINSQAQADKFNALNNTHHAYVQETSRRLNAITKLAKAIKAFT